MVSLLSVSTTLLVLLAAASSDGFTPVRSYMTPRGLLTADMIKKNRQLAARDIELPAPVQVSLSRDKREADEGAWKSVPSGIIYSATPQVISSSGEETPEVSTPTGKSAGKPLVRHERSQSVAKKDESPAQGAVVRQPFVLPKPLQQILSIDRSSVSNPHGVETVYGHSVFKPLSPNYRAKRPQIFRGNSESIYNTASQLLNDQTQNSAFGLSNSGNFKTSVTKGQPFVLKGDDDASLATSALKIHKPKKNAGLPVKYKTTNFVPNSDRGQFYSSLLSQSKPKPQAAEISTQESETLENSDQQSLLRKLRQAHIESEFFDAVQHASGLPLSHRVKDGKDVSLVIGKPTLLDSKTITPGGFSGSGGFLSGIDGSEEIIELVAKTPQVLLQEPLETSQFSFSKPSSYSGPSDISLSHGVIPHHGPLLGHSGVAIPGRPKYFSLNRVPHGYGGYPTHLHGGYSPKYRYPSKGYGRYPAKGYGRYPLKGQGGYPVKGYGGYPSAGYGGFRTKGYSGYPTKGYGGYHGGGYGAYPAKGFVGFPEKAYGGYPSYGGYGGYSQKGYATPPVKGYTAVPQKGYGGYHGPAYGGYPEKGFSLWPFNKGYGRPQPKGYGGGYPEKGYGGGYGVGFPAKAYGGAYGGGYPAKAYGGGYGGGYPVKGYGGGYPTKAYGGGYGGGYPVKGYGGGYPVKGYGGGYPVKGYGGGYPVKGYGGGYHAGGHGYDGYRPGHGGFATVYGDSSVGHGHGYGDHSVGYGDHGLGHGGYSDPYGGYGPGYHGAGYSEKPLYDMGEKVKSSISDFFYNIKDKLEHVGYEIKDKWNYLFSKAESNMANMAAKKPVGYGGPAYGHPHGYHVGGGYASDVIPHGDLHGIDLAVHSTLSSASPYDGHGIHGGVGHGIGGGGIGHGDVVIDHGVAHVEPSVYHAPTEYIGGTTSPFFSKTIDPATGLEIIGESGIKGVSQFGHSSGGGAVTSYSQTPVYTPAHAKGVSSKVVHGSGVYKRETKLPPKHGKVGEDAETIAESLFPNTDFVFQDQLGALSHRNAAGENQEFQMEFVLENGGAQAYNEAGGRYAVNGAEDSSQVKYYLVKDKDENIADPLASRKQVFAVVS